MVNSRERTASAAERHLVTERTVPAGLCAHCLHLRVLASQRSVFVRCGLADADPQFPRYPALPVTACAGYQEDPTCS